MSRSNESIAIDLAQLHCYERELGRLVPLTAICADYPHLISDVAEIIAAFEAVETLRQQLHDENEHQPAKIGRYLIQQQIGHGGMGLVYRGRDEQLGRPVAVKLLRQRFLHFDSFHKRFLFEAQVTARMEHPAIPTVYQIDTLADGRPYYAMKLVVGRNLNEIIRDKSFEWNHLAVFEAICQGVAYAHECGVIHRDLKPQNVMIGPHGEVHVVDWGLAKKLDSADDLASSMYLSLHDFNTHYGCVIGTPAYMAPEQARGDIEKLDRRTDVFGLGAILYAILTGTPLYEGDSPSTTLQLAIHGKAKGQIGERLSRVSNPHLTQICTLLLSPDQSMRPEHAGIVADLIRSYRTRIENQLSNADLKLVDDQYFARIDLTRSHSDRVMVPDPAQKPSSQLLSMLEANPLEVRVGPPNPVRSEDRDPYGMTSYGDIILNDFNSATKPSTIATTNHTLDHPSGDVEPVELVEELEPEPFDELADSGEMFSYPNIIFGFCLGVLISYVSPTLGGVVVVVYTVIQHAIKLSRNR
jgi:serine/threonine protein kinase